MRPHGERRGDEARPVPRCCQRHSAARRAALPVAAVGAVAVRRGAGLGAAMAPRQPGLPRAVLRWLQSLDLPACPRHCRRCAGPGRAKGGPGSGNTSCCLGRDFSNGYLVAEILARYFPAEIRSRACGTGSSLPTKLSNWARLQRVRAPRCNALWPPSPPPKILMGSLGLRNEA